MAYRKQRRSPPWLTFSDLLGNAFFLIILVLGIFLIRSGSNRQPPIIDLSETASYSFTLGSFMPSPEFTRRLRKEVSPRIIKLLREYPSISSVEIIGHTDGVPNGEGLPSNLDTQNINSDLEASKDRLYRPGSNTDLGLLRALYVKSVLNNEIQRICSSNKRKQLECRHISYRVYSAGSLISLKGDIKPANGESDPSRRRIEIRFTR